MGNVSPLPAAIRPSFVRALKGWYTRKGFPARCVLTCLLLSAHRPAAGGRSQGIPSAGIGSILAGGSQPLQQVPSEVQQQQAQECCSVRTCRYPAGPVGTSRGFLKLPSPPREAVAHPELHAGPHPAAPTQWATEPRPLQGAPTLGSQVDEGQLLPHWILPQP